MNNRDKSKKSAKPAAAPAPTAAEAAPVAAEAAPAAESGLAAAARNDVGAVTAVPKDADVDAPDNSEDLSVATQPANKPKADSLESRLSADKAVIESYVKNMGSSVSNTPEQIGTQQMRLVRFLTSIPNTSDDNKSFARRWGQVMEAFGDVNDGKNPFGLRLASRWIDLDQPPERILLARFISLCTTHAINGPKGVGRYMDFNQVFGSALSEKGLGLLSSYYA